MTPPRASLPRPSAALLAVALLVLSLGPVGAAAAATSTGNALAVLPSGFVGPSGILPSTGIGVLINALGAAGFGLLILGAATLLVRRRSARI